MRKFLSVFFVLSLGTIAHAQADEQKAFDCVDKQTFQVNSQCMADRISQNTQYRTMQVDIANKAVVQNDAVMATIKYYPKDSVIEVVAHRDASLSAAVKH